MGLEICGLLLYFYFTLLLLLRWNEISTLCIQSATVCSSYNDLSQCSNNDGTNQKMVLWHIIK